MVGLGVPLPVDIFAHFYIGLSFTSDQTEVKSIYVGRKVVLTHSPTKACLSAHSLKRDCITMMTHITS